MKDKFKKKAWLTTTQGEPAFAGHHCVWMTTKTSNNHGGKRKKKEWGDNFPMHKDLRSLLDNPEQDVTRRFAVQDVPDNLDPEEYVNVETS